MIGVRVDPAVVDEFRKLAERESSGLGLAVQRLMEAAVACGSIQKLTGLARMGSPRFARADRERVKRAIVALAGEFRRDLSEWLEVKGKYLVLGGIQDALEELQGLIHLVDDERLLKRAERLMVDSLIFVKASQIEDREARRRFLKEAEQVTGAISPRLRHALLTAPEEEG